MNEEEYKTLLLEEQYVARLSQTLQMQFQGLRKLLAQDKYHVQANAQLPKVKADMKEIMGLSAAMSKRLVEAIAGKYELKLPYLMPEPAPIPKKVV